VQVSPVSTRRPRTDPEDADGLDGLPAFQFNLHLDPKAHVRLFDQCEGNESGPVRNQSPGDATRHGLILSSLGRSPVPHQAHLLYRYPASGDGGSSGDGSSPAAGERLRLVAAGQRVLARPLADLPGSEGGQRWPAEHLDLRRT